MSIQYTPTYVGYGTNEPPSQTSAYTVQPTTDEQDDVSEDNDDEEPQFSELAQSAVDNTGLGNTYSLAAETSVPTKDWNKEFTSLWQLPVCDFQMVCK